jgi:hypothetical protein
MLVNSIGHHYGGLIKNHLVKDYVLLHNYRNCIAMIHYGYLAINKIGNTTVIFIINEMENNK